MLIHSASQLLTLAGGPQRGADLGRLGIIDDGAMLIQGDAIAAVVAGCRAVIVASTDLSHYNTAATAAYVRGSTGFTSDGISTCRM